MNNPDTDWEVNYYHTPRGDSPPVDFIKSLQTEDKAKILRYIELLKKLGTTITYPYSEHLMGSLWQLRPLPHRLIYVAWSGHRFVMLHAFRKKSRKTKQKDIDIALSRLEDLKRRTGHE